MANVISIEDFKYGSGKYKVDIFDTSHSDWFV